MIWTQAISCFDIGNDHSNKLFTVLNINIRSIRHKTNLLDAFLCDRGVQAVCVTEHYLTEPGVDSCVLDNYLYIGLFPLS